jgi:hypothetical protein
MQHPRHKLDPDGLQLFLRVKHPGIDPADISRELNVEPEYANRAGASVSERGVKRLYSESYWLASLPVRSIQELASWASSSGLKPSAPSTAAQLSSLRSAHATGVHGMQILLWLKTLEARASFLKRLNDEGGSITLVVQRPDRDAPFVVSPAVSQRLAQLEIGLEIE